MKNKNSINFWIDIISLLIMIGLVLTGGLMYFVLPSGTGRTHMLFGYNRHDFGDFHLYLAAASLVLIVTHICLHWNWLCRMAVRALGDKSNSRLSRQAWGVVLIGGFLIFLFGSMWWASSEVEQNTRNVDTPDRDQIASVDCPQGMAINGRTTLFQAAGVCGVSVERFRQLLSLPARVDASEHLGRLKRLHGLSIHDVRKLACR